MSQRVHIALGVPDLATAIQDYERFLGLPPELVVPDEYALFRTAELNLSLRVQTGTPGVRHLGFENDAADRFTTWTDSHGFVWENFSPAAQLAEIRETWPEK